LVAWRVLEAVGDGAYADLALERELRRQPLAPLDRGLATELAYGAIRQRRRLDAWLDQLGKVPAERQPPKLRWLLHLGLYQLLLSERVPDSAAVSTTVELAKRGGLARLAPVVNGILRGVLRTRSRAQAPLPSGQEGQPSLPAWLGLPGQELAFPMAKIAQAVLLFLGIPLLAGYLSRRFGLLIKGRNWYEQRFIPRISPLALYGLLFTIVVMFALQGQAITSNPLQVFWIAIPLFIYFVLMFFTSFFIGIFLKVPYDKNASVSFTATGNNFELAIAVAIAVFGIHSPQAFAGVIGPLVEVPVLILLVKVSLYLKTKYYSS
jgi:transcription termination factor NusB